MHPEFERELRRLARFDISYAEAWRQLIPVGKRIQQPRPSYRVVREFLELEIDRLMHQSIQRERFVSTMLAGRVPRPK
jgi:hypothetical protein